MFILFFKENLIKPITSAKAFVQDVFTFYQDLTAELFKHLLSLLNIYLIFHSNQVFPHKDVIIEIANVLVIHGFQELDDL